MRADKRIYKGTGKNTLRYTTLYFDLDNTLLDFSAAQAKAISELLRLYKIEPKPEHITLYSNVNKMFWERYERGEISRGEIFEGRFIEFAKRIGAKINTAKMSKDYFCLLAKGHDVIPGAVEILEYVKAKGYTVCATTNGVSVTQHKRIRESGILGWFDYVFISENTGHYKPEKEYFDFVIDHTPEKDPGKILIIGDSLTSDIAGGINAGIDTCWLNAEGVAARILPTYEIRNISELKHIL